MKNLIFKKNLTLVFFITTVFSLSISAQENQQDTVQMDEVVVTGSKQNQSIGNVTQKIDVISSKEINTIVSGNRNVSEAIMYQPGSSVSTLSRNDANWGTYGGIGPKYSTYMINGLPIDAFVDPMSLDLNAVDKIEVQRGPASVLYPNYLSQDFAGNQSPLAGTVNLIMKEKIDKPMTRLSTSFGSYNTLNGQVYHQGLNKDQNLHYFFGSSYEMSDYTNYGTDGSWLNMQKNPEYRKSKFYGGTTWYPGSNGKQKFSLFFNKTLHTGDAGRVYRGYDNNYGLINAGYSVDVNDKVKFQAHLGLRQYDRQSQESNKTGDTLQSNNGVYQNIVPADIMLSIKHGENHLFLIGGDFQGADYHTWSDPLIGYQKIGNKSNAMQSGIYAQEEMHFGGLTVRGGLRYSYIRNNMEMVDGVLPSLSKKEWTALLWSGGLKYKVANLFSVFANAGNSFMTPGLKSVGGTIALNDTLRNGQLPNSNLKPESGIGFDAGANVNLPLNFKVTIRGFMINITDAIITNSVRQSPSQSMDINAGKSSSTGVEIEIKEKLSNDLYWFTNFTKMNTKITNSGTDQEGANIPFSPGMVANLGIGYTTPFGLQINPYINYNDGFYDSSSKTGRKKFTPGAMINLYVSQVIVKTESYRIDGFGQFYNITNNKYEMPWQFRDPGFSFMAGVRATF